MYLKDESVHPIASLKHRLARSRFLYARCNGWIGSGSAVIEASSGSTAVSEAYFARLIGLPFVAVMPASRSAEKIALIEFYGGRCHLVEDAGAGGTSATIGRFVRYRRYATRIAVADPENPAFYEGWESDRSDVTTKVPSRIEGIGRMRVEPSFGGGSSTTWSRCPMRPRLPRCDGSSTCSASRRIDRNQHLGLAHDRRAHEGGRGNPKRRDTLV